MSYCFNFLVCQIPASFTSTLLTAAKMLMALNTLNDVTLWLKVEGDQLQHLV